MRPAVAGVILLILEAAGATLAAPETAPACALTTVATAQARRAIDGRTLLLADGREIRLADIETPPPDTTPAGGGPDRAAAARDTLDMLVAGQDVVLRHVTPATDRYGRQVMRVFVDAAGSPRSLAELLVAQGHALVARRPGEAACQRELVAAERAARTAKLGLWGDPRYELKRAQNPGEILAVRGRYALVEGRVLSVRESGGTIYVNFGRRWTEDFTVTISKRNERLFVAAGLAPKVFEGRSVRVRGVVEERGGPWIEAVRPEQIELVDGN